MKKKKRVKKKVYIIILIFILILSSIIIFENINKDEIISMDQTIYEQLENEIKYRNIENVFIFKKTGRMATDVSKEIGDLFQNKLPNLYEETKNLNIEELKEYLEKNQHTKGKFTKIDLDNLITLIKNARKLTIDLKEYDYCDFINEAENAVKAICYYKNGEKLEIYLIEHNNEGLINIIVK